LEEEGAPAEPALPNMLRHWRRASRENSKMAGSVGGWKVQEVKRLVGMKAIA
jgi:hypothetical protein